MNVTETEKLVAATLAAAVISSQKVEKPRDQVLAYEKILQVIARRKDRDGAKVKKGA